MAKSQNLITNLNVLLDKKLFEDLTDQYEKLRFVKELGSLYTSQKRVSLINILTAPDIPDANLYETNVGKGKTAFNDIRQKTPELKVLEKVITFDMIRDYLVKCYVEERLIPTKLPFTEENYLKEKNLTWFPSLLANHNFQFKQLPGSKKKILVETTESVNKRVAYLLKMKTFRDQKKHLVYVTVVKLLKDSDGLPHADNVISKFQIAVSNRIGMINCKAQTVVNDETLAQWLEEDVLKKIEGPAIAVMSNVPFLKNTIQPLTLFSTKAEIIECLEDNDVPFTPSMHKSELLNLTKKTRCRRKVDSGTANAIAKFNIDVIYTPDNVSRINLLDNDKITVSMFNLIISYDATNWAQLEQVLIQGEENVLKEDKEMEDIIDSVMTYAKYTGIEGDEIDGFQNQSELADNGAWLERVLPNFNKA